MENKNEMYDDECVDLKEVVLEGISIPFQELGDLCEIIYDKEEIINIGNQLSQELQEHISIYLAEARKRVSDLKTEIQTLSDEVKLLEQVLIGNSSKISFSDVLTLKEKKAMLLEMVKPLRQKKDEYLLILKQLRNEEYSLLEALGRDKIYLIDSDVPTSEHLNDFRLYINKLTDETAAQHIEIEQIKNEINKLVKQLGIEAELDFNVETKTRDITDKYLEKLKDIRRVLSKKKEQHIAKKDKLLDKLSNLWNRISMDVDGREEFLAKYQDYKESTIKAFENEIERCEELKKLHLSEYIQKLQMELEDLWDKCKIGQEERVINSSFALDDSDDHGEHILNECEELVEYYNRVYTDNRKLFDMLEERFDLYNQFIALENSANNPSRLFQNRGGKLLQEEKTRKKIVSTLPKFDKEILKLAKDYEKCYQTEFSYLGRPIKDVLEETNVTKKKTSNKENVQTTTSSGLKLMKPFPKKWTPTPQTSNRLIVANAVMKSAPPNRIIRRHMFSGETTE